MDGTCRQRIAGARAPFLVLLDARGLGSATLMYASADGFAIECRVAIEADGTFSVVRVFSAPSDRAVDAPGAVQSLTGDFRPLGRDRANYHFESGVVTRQVAQVVVVLGGDQQIRASVGNGFYAVSWPDSPAAFERRAYDANGALIPSGR